MLAYGLKHELQANIMSASPDQEQSDNKLNKSENENGENGEGTQGIYVKFANYFVDDNDNLKDIMVQLGVL